jgi:hypothetical protein
MCETRPRSSLMLMYAFEFVMRLCTSESYSGYGYRLLQLAAGGGGEDTSKQIALVHSSIVKHDSACRIKGNETLRSLAFAIIHESRVKLFYTRLFPQRRTNITNLA